MHSVFQYRTVTKSFLNALSVFSIVRYLVAALARLATRTGLLWPLVCRSSVRSLTAVKLCSPSLRLLAASVAEAAQDDGRKTSSVHVSRTPLAS